jgi:hypothetical protein
MNLDVIKRRIKHCVDLIYENDSDLFGRGNYEVTISSKLAQYLFLEFKDYDVDCEYDRHIDNEKRVDILNSNVRPDIVIHKRGTDSHNLAYIEIKKEQNVSSREHDFDKISAMTVHNGEYNYSIGVFIDFSRYKNRLVIRYFVNGDEIQ